MRERLLERIGSFFAGPKTSVDCRQEVETPRGVVIRTRRVQSDGQRPITIVGLPEEHPPLQTAVKLTDFDH